ncbi:glycosyltransferase family 4 protein [Candidatus Saccharibacteria bacterium]|nr:glycosyltransferase family 4 protein [Candidatus Saccharibacteria bacterium]
MNILMLGWELPPHNSGGLGVACYHMSKALADQGADIDFVVPYHADHSDIDFMKVHCATPLNPLERYGLGAYDSDAVIKAMLTDVNTTELTDIRGVQKRYVQYVEELLVPMAPDLIHAHDWLTMEAGMRAKELTGAPLIVHVHATEYDRAGSNYGNPVVHEIERQGLIMADKIIAVSNITKNMVVERYGIPADKVDVLHNAIDVASYDDNYINDRNTYKYLESLKAEGYTIISTVTRFTVQKGLVNFVNAAAKAISKYDKLAFLLAGDGELRNQLVQLTADLGIADKVFMTGFVRGKEWRDTYITSDVFVMSSVSEPFGLTALEAAHYDNAVVVTHQSGVSEVLYNVFKYNFWDEDVLADKIVGLATSPVLRDCLRNDVKAEYNRLSWMDVAKTCMDIYDSLQLGALPS